MLEHWLGRTGLCVGLFVVVAATGAWWTWPETIGEEGMEVRLLGVYQQGDRGVHRIAVEWPEHGIRRRAGKILEGEGGTWRLTATTRHDMGTDIGMHGWDDPQDAVAELSGDAETRRRLARRADEYGKSLAFLKGIGLGVCVAFGAILGLWAVHAWTKRKEGKG